MAQASHARTQMAREIAEIPHAVQRLIDDSLDQCIALGRSLRADPPAAFVTCARGTSDQAALYFKCLVERNTGIPVASIGPSIASVYDAPLRVKGMVCVTISQSGGSPDLARLQDAAADGGARTIALLNTIDSPIGDRASEVVDLRAGEEVAVAATKSFVCSLVAGAALVAGMTGDDGLIGGIMTLPGLLEDAISTGPSGGLEAIAESPSVFVLSRGVTMAAAGEAALKLKETCQLHAEAYSAAEVMHGPSALAARGVATVTFLPEDAGRESVVSARSALRAAGSPAITIGSQDSEISVPATGNSALAPAVQIARFYRLVEALSVQSGLDPDCPPGLRKITRTF